MARHSRIMLISVFIACLFRGEARENRLEDVMIRCYRNSMENYQEVPLYNSTDILKLGCFDSSEPTILYAHGYKGHPEGVAVQAVISTYVSQQDKNVFLVDWSNMATSNGLSLITGYLRNAAPNTKKVGEALAEQIMMWIYAGFDISTLHTVGHSLGAHLLGFCGEEMRYMNVILPRITGLDPAHEGFEPATFGGSLDPNDAKFVDVIHSSPSRYGSRRSHGTVDFWPNYNSSSSGVQPGCSNERSPMFSESDLCSHHRAWQLWVEAVLYPDSFMAIRAKNYKQFASKRFQNSNVHNRIDTTYMGADVPNRSKGNYYFFTSSDYPYGLNEDGLYV